MVQDAQFKLQAAVTKTASFDSAAVDLGLGFAPNEGGKAMRGVVPVTAIDLTSGNETYTFKLQESDDNAMFTDVSPAVAATAVGLIHPRGFVSKRYVRLSMAAAGTTPSITYGDAYLNPVIN